MYYLLVLFASLLSTTSFAEPPVPGAPDIAAKAYLIQDFDSGQIIAEKNADERMEPASITKLMSMHVIFNEIRRGTLTLSDSVRISKKAWQMEGSRMFVKVGTTVPVADLIKGVIIQSGNDATVALAEKIAGTESNFASLMNHHAAELGMSNSHFMNSTGLPDKEHYMSARDIATLSRALIAEFPEYYKWYSEREFRYNDITQYNRNLLLGRDKSVDGIKTGHTKSAGYCLVTSALRDKMRLITVVLGTESKEARANTSQALLDYGFRFFETHKLYDAGKQLTTTRVWKGRNKEVSLGLDETLYITIPRGQYDKLDASMQIAEQIMAPVDAGTMLGTVSIKLGDEVLSERPLTALTAIPQGAIWQRLFDSALLYFQ
ncbi:MAG: D-alanyl-D-alanine carboxypeptidase family protein [Gammaproteobacteria bacterium]